MYFVAISEGRKSSSQEKAEASAAGFPSPNSKEELHAEMPESARVLRNPLAFF